MFEIASWIFLLLGLVGGFGLSFAFWWWVNHRLVPEISFSKELGKRSIEYDKPPFRHQFAFKNVGKRSVVNIRLKVRLVIVDPLRRGSTLKNFFDIALPNYEIFELKPGEMMRMALQVHRSDRLHSMIIDESLRAMVINEDATLDDIFETYPNAYLYVQLIGTDVYSHATKVFQSVNYRKQDVRKGTFKEKSLVVTKAKVLNS